MYSILMLVLVLACVGALFREGIWSNAITLINTITAALLATNYYEPATKSLSDAVPWMDYNWDVVVLGVLFCVIYLVLRAVAAYCSKYQVRFHPLAEQAGGALLAVWVGWVAVCFITFSLHTSSLSRNFLFGSFVPENKMVFGLAPDRQWLAFVTKLSDGGGWGTNATDEAGNVTSVFDPKTEFLMKHASRRQYLETRESPFASTGPQPQ